MKALLLLVLAASTAYAAPVGIGDSKSADTAIALSLGSTAAGLGLMFVGAKSDSGALGGVGAAMFLVGPTTGHMYAGDTFESTQRSVGAVMFYGGASLYIGGSAYEIGTAPDAAHRYNREHGLEATIVPTGNGLALAGRF